MANVFQNALRKPLALVLHALIAIPTVQAAQVQLTLALVVSLIHSDLLIGVLGLVQFNIMPT